jgi:hypothetical protein
MRLLAALLSAALPVFAKSAEDYFHGAAYRYVEGKIQEAAAEADEGLRAYPDDAKLRSLAGQLHKMQDKQKGDSGNDKNKDSKDGKDPDKKKNDPDKPKDGKNGSDPNKSGQGKPNDPNNPKEPPPGSGQNPDRPQDGQDRPQQGKMTEKEAERLLNSFADDEKKEQAERRRVVRPRAGTEQDW